MDLGNKQSRFCRFLFGSNSNAKTVEAGIANKQINELSEGIALRDKSISDLSDIIGQRDNTIIELQNFIDERDQAIFALQDTMGQRDQAIFAIYDYMSEGVTDTFLDKYSYGDLHNIIEAAIDAKEMENIFSLYKQMMLEVFDRITKMYSGGKIRVVILTSMPSRWSCQSLYDKLTQDKDKFDTKVVVAPCIYSEYEKCLKNYIRDCDYYESKGIDIKRAYNAATGEYINYEGMGLPHVIVHLLPYTNFFDDKLKITSYPLKTLNIYIPYGIYAVDDPGRQFDLPMHHLCWRIYAETEIQKQLAARYSACADFNVRTSGYLKMDESYIEHNYDDRHIWKITEKTKYKIIYSPHHSVVDIITATGTFHLNHQFFYELAKRMDAISWIIKPHPLLWSDMVLYGHFKSENEFDEYMQKWNELPNARVVLDEPYQDIFETSDAMINDSISFIGEYLYYDKPGLFLTKKENRFNEFGELALECYYQVDGSEFEAIERFINDIVIGGNDTLKDHRKFFYNKYLNYKTMNEKLAVDFIYDDILNAFKQV